MADQKSKNIYEVEFLLSYTIEEPKGIDPHHINDVVELMGDEVQNDQLKKELAEFLRKRIAALNEYPEDIVIVEVLNFGKKNK
jgi:acyl-coenzyme A synthetase/AMP-(fatty) acid ligase